MNCAMKELEERIGYSFKNAALLETALTTPACRMDRPEVEDNQRLEFLGDAVFGLLSADAVFEAYPWEQEGALTVRRTHLVSGSALTAAAERVGLGKFLKRNSGAAPLPPHAKVLADAIEAVMGAVWLDGGIEAVRAVFERLELPIDGSQRVGREPERPSPGAVAVAAAFTPANLHRRFGEGAFACANGDRDGGGGGARIGHGHGWFAEAGRGRRRHRSAGEDKRKGRLSAIRWHDHVRYARIHA